jgi:hypothetical protein
METLGLFMAAGDGIGVFFVIFIIAAVIGVIVWGAAHQKKVRENWLRFAQQHGLNVTGAPNRPFIQGWMGSTYVTLNTEVRGSGKNRTTYTQYHASVNSPMPSGLVMHKEGFFSKVGKVLGGQDVQVGDSAIDGAFIIKGNDVNGIHTLLRNPHVKKALLYVVTRQPGLQVKERALLIEHTGMTGDLAKIEGVFADLCYLVQTLDAAYQELAGAPAPTGRPPARTKSVPRQAPISSRAAAAEILGASILNQPQVRRASPEEDPAQRARAMGDMANVLSQHGQNLASGASQPDVLTNFARSDSMEGKASDVFKANDPGDVFAASNSTGRAALDNYNPANAWDSKSVEGDEGQSGFAAFDAPVDSSAFEDPKPIDEPAPEGEIAGSFTALLEMLSDGSLMSSDRDDIIERHEDMEWPIEVTVDRIDNTWGFELPDGMKDGKTVEGHAGERKFAVRFPKARNTEIGNLRSGATVKARGKLSAWDDLFKKATLDAG